MKCTAVMAASKPALSTKAHYVKQREAQFQYINLCTVNEVN